MSTMTRPATIRLLAAVASLLLVSALIVRTTDAAFSDTTANTSNSFAAGSVAISGADGDPLFWLDPDGTFSVNASGLVPGDVRTSGCLVLTYGGDVPTGAPVTLSTPGGFGGTGLEEHLNVTVDVFSDGSCSTLSGKTVSGTLDALASGAFAAGTGWDTGWQPTTNGDVQSFRFTVEVVDTNAAQGLSVDAVDFTWTASS